MRELYQYIGKVGSLRVEGGKLTIPVKVIDVASNFGRVDFEVQPVNGTGSVKVSESRISFEVK